MEYTPSIQCKQRETLLTAINNHQFADTTFIIGKEQTEYNVNRMFLSLISPVFKAMLFGKMKESQPNSDVIIEDMKSEIFQCIINFAYCNDPKVNKNNVLLLIKQCDKYQITALSELCHEYLISILDADSFCALFLEATTLNILSGKIHEIMGKYFTNNWEKCLNSDNFCTFFDMMVRSNQSNFIRKSQHYLQISDISTNQHIITNDAFKKISLKTMRLILNTQPFICKEETLWDAVLKWARYQSKINSELQSDYEADRDDVKDTDDETTDTALNGYAIYLLKSIRDLIRFGLMDGKYFALNVAPLNILTSQELIAVLLYFQNTDGGCGSFLTQTRSSVYVKIIYCDNNTGEIDTNKYELNTFTKGYTLKQLAKHLQEDMKCDEEDTPYVRIWLQFCHIKVIYPIDNENAKITTEDLENENGERWVEMPNDYMKTSLDAICLHSFPIAIERKQENNAWPRAKSDDWRETLQTGDIIDAADIHGQWYEALVRFVYPKDSDKSGQCVIHYIGWSIKWDEIVDINNTNRLAKRNTHTNGPHIPNLN